MLAHAAGTAPVSRLPYIWIVLFHGKWPGTAHAAGIVPGQGTYKLPAFQDVKPCEEASQQA